MNNYILAIDQGTTGTTALIFDRSLDIIGKATKEFPQHFPKPSWVEHDLDQIWHSVQEAVNAAMAQRRIEPNEICAIGITNQRETTCLWEDVHGARQVAPAIVWQDRRTADICQKLKSRGLEKGITKKTGLLLDPYFSASKLQWLLNNIPQAKSQATKGKYKFGTIDSYLVYRITGNHVTDVSNASRTMLMDLKTCQWDDDLLKLFGIPRACLPSIFPSSTEYGVTKKFLNLPDGIPVTGIAGDQQAALFGQACFSKGDIKCTYGTGAFALVNTGEKIVYSKSRLLTTVAWKMGSKVTYGLEGSAFIAGAAVQWLRDGLDLISQSSQVEPLASAVNDSDGVTFIPALSGMGAPYWLTGATGLITGITRRTTKAHIARATLEGMALQVRELLTCISKDYAKNFSTIKVDGGASENNLLMQYQADVLGAKVVRAKILETTALGAGLQAGLAVGYWNSMDEVKRLWESSREFSPNISTKQRSQIQTRWNRVMKAVKLLSESGAK